MTNKSKTKKTNRSKKVKTDKWNGHYSDHKETGVEVYFNNSGGHWWLNKKDEKGLKREGFCLSHPQGQWITDDHITSAFILCNSMEEGLAAFRKATQYTGRELGCISCCGPPFSFTFYKDGKREEHWSPSAPYEGKDY